MKNGLEGLKALYKVMGEEIENLEKQEGEGGLPKSWDDLKEIKGYFLGSDGSAIGVSRVRADLSHGSVFPTKKEAEASLAWSQLLQLRDAYNGEKIDDWCDWSGGRKKFSIKREGSNIRAKWGYCPYTPLAFKTMELRDEFLKNFEELIKTAYCM